MTSSHCLVRERRKPLTEEPSQSEQTVTTKSEPEPESSSSPIEWVNKLLYNSFLEKCK